MLRSSPPGRLGLAALLLASSAAGQIPATFVFEGRLQAPVGTAWTTPVSATLRLHDDELAGSVGHVELETLVPDAGGRFAVTLGDGAALDAALFAEETWLSIEVDGATLGPRLPVLPAPLALRAAAAAGLDPSAPVDMGGYALSGLPTPVTSTDAVPKDYVDGVAAGLSDDIADVGADLSAHTGDGSVHFPQATITIATTQVSDFDAGVSASSHALDGSLHFSQAAILVTTAQVSGFDAAVSASTHAQDASIHYPQASIGIDSSQVTDFDAAVSASTHAGRTDNPHQVGKAQLGLGEVPNSKVNVTAGVVPTASDDGTQGYAVGSTWIDTGSATASWLTTLAGPGQARWQAVTPSRRVLQVSPVVVAGVIDPEASGYALRELLLGISDASATNPYAVRLEPGTYRTTQTVNLPAYVDLVGAGIGATILDPDRSFNTAESTRIQDLSFEVATGDFGTVFVGANDEVTLERVRFQGSGLGGAHAAIEQASGGTCTLRVLACEIELSAADAGAFYTSNTNVGNSYLFRDTLIDVTSTSGDAETFRVIRGSLRILGGRISATATGSAYGVKFLGSSSIDTEVRGVEIEVDSGGTEGFGLEVKGERTIVVGNRFRVQGGSSCAAVDSTADEGVIAGNSIEITEGSGTSSVRGITADAGSTIEGNTIQIDVSSAARGINLFGSAPAVVAGNAVDVACAGGDGAGIYLSSATRASVADNSVALAYGGTSAGNGIRVSSGEASFTGNTVRVDATGGGGASAAGIYSLSAASLSGNRVRVTSTGTGTSYGLRLSNARGYGVSGLLAHVSAAGDAYGIHAAGELALGSSRVVLETSDGVAVGIFVGEDLTGTGVDLEVTNTGLDVGDDAIGVQAVPLADEHVVLAASRYLGTASGGSSYVVDALDDGDRTPDLLVAASRMSAEFTGTDLLCDAASECP